MMIRQQTQRPVTTSTYGQRIAEARRSRGWNLRRAEQEIGVSTATLSRLERAITEPSASTMVRIEAILHVPYRYEDAIPVVLPAEASTSRLLLRFTDDQLIEELVRRGVLTERDR